MKISYPRVTSISVYIARVSKKIKNSKLEGYEEGKSMLILTILFVVPPKELFKLIPCMVRHFVGQYGTLTASKILC